MHHSHSHSSPAVHVVSCGAVLFFPFAQYWAAGNYLVHIITTPVHYMGGELHILFQLCTALLCTMLCCFPLLSITCTNRGQCLKGRHLFGLLLPAIIPTLQDTDLSLCLPSARFLSHCCRCGTPHSGSNEVYWVAGLIALGAEKAMGGCMCKSMHTKDSWRRKRIEKWHSHGNWMVMRQKI